MAEVSHAWFTQRQDTNALIAYCHTNQEAISHGTWLPCALATCSVRLRLHGKRTASCASRSLEEDSISAWSLSSSQVVSGVALLSFRDAMEESSVRRL